MSLTKNESMSSLKLGRKIGQSLIVNWLVPVVLFTVLRYFISNDTTALAIVVSIPTVRLIGLWLLKHRIDWIGVLSFLGFTMALLATLLSGGSSLPLMLYHPIVTGTLGMAFVVSAILRKPLLLTLLKLMKPDKLERLEAPSFLKKITVSSALIGLLLISDAVAHIVMALTLPTGTFLVTSKFVTLGILAILVSIKWVVGRAKSN